MFRINSCHQPPLTVYSHLNLPEGNSPQHCVGFLFLALHPASAFSSDASSSPHQPHLTISHKRISHNSHIPTSYHNRTQTHPTQLISHISSHKLSSHICSHNTSYTIHLTQLIYHISSHKIASQISSHKSSHTTSSHTIASHISSRPTHLT